MCPLCVYLLVTLLRWDAGAGPLPPARGVVVLDVRQERYLPRQTKLEKYIGMY